MAIAAAGAGIARVGVSVGANTGAAQTAIGGVQSQLGALGASAQKLGVPFLATSSIADRVDSSFGALALSTEDTTNAFLRSRGFIDGVRNKLFDLTEAIFGSEFALRLWEREWLTLPGIVGLVGSAVDDFSKLTETILNTALTPCKMTWAHRGKPPATWVSAWKNPG